MERLCELVIRCCSASIPLLLRWALCLRKCEMLGGVMYTVPRTCPQPCCGLDISETAALVDEAEGSSHSQGLVCSFSKTWQEEELQQEWVGTGRVMRHWSTVFPLCKSQAHRLNYSYLSINWTSPSFSSSQPFSFFFFLLNILFTLSLRLPSGASAKEPSCQCRRHKRLRFNPWVGKIPWRRAWQSTPEFLPGKFHGQRSLACCSPWGCKQSDMT